MIKLCLCQVLLNGPSCLHIPIVKFTFAESKRYKNTIVRGMFTLKNNPFGEEKVKCWVISSLVNCQPLLIWYACSCCVYGPLYFPVRKASVWVLLWICPIYVSGRNFMDNSKAKSIVVPWIHIHFELMKCFRDYSALANITSYSLDFHWSMSELHFCIHYIVFVLVVFVRCHQVASDL